FATGSASYDFYGANRVGDDLFANSIVALDANSGKRVWHFQGLKHDLWDRDFPAAPALVTVTRDGKPVDAIAQITKTGHVWLLERETGRELFPSEWRRMPKGMLPGEVTADSQRFPTLPEPFVRQRLTEADLTDRTAEAHAAALKIFRENPTPDPFTPPNEKGIIIFPGVDGGGEYGGPAFDPETGLLYVNANEMGWVLKIVPREENSLFGAYCAECHGPKTTPRAPSLTGVAQRLSREQIVQTIRSGTGRMPAFAAALNDSAVAELAEYVRSGSQPRQTPRDVPTFVKYRNASFDIFLDHEGYPAIKPPWGTLTAIDLNSGARKWAIPLGEYPKLAAQGLKDTGSDNYGGAIVTRNGLLIIAATTHDNRIRAFDKSTGKLLWEAPLPAAGNATPATYMVTGRQYIVIACGGGKNDAPSGGRYVAFALPERR
ncbi:MAG TPA: c-type cytochrome, partial [Gemmatimonadales bacterium]|nr:c-type cytochrome [Gemmatimonadales bacterium]